MELRRVVNNVSHVFFHFFFSFQREYTYIYIYILSAGILHLRGREKSRPVVVRPFMVRQACSEGVSAAIFQAEGFFGILKTIRGRLWMLRFCRKRMKRRE